MNEPALENDLAVERTIVLGGLYGTMPERLYEAIRHRARERIPILPSGEVCTAESLLGMRFWADLPKAYRLLAGRALAHQTASGHLPLEPVRLGRHTSRCYRLPD